MSNTIRSQPSGSAEDDFVPRVPERPGFGFLLGGLTLGLLFGCLLLCAGASPPHIILILLAVCGAFSGGLLESFWPKPTSLPQATTHRCLSRTPKAATDHECRRCGEVFPPNPIICPMCGHQEERDIG